MNQREVKKLSHGIYRLHWKSGGSSMASVGSTKSGIKWMAPTNWVSAASNKCSWGAVLRAERIEGLND